PPWSCRSNIRLPAEYKDCFSFHNPGFAGVAVGPTGASRVVAQRCDHDTCGHTVADADVGLYCVECPLVDYSGDRDFEGAIAVPRALRPMSCPPFVARYRVDDPNRLAAMIGGVALLKRWRLDHQRTGLGVKRHRYIVGCADLLGADAFLFDQPHQWRGKEAQD